MTAPPWLSVWLQGGRADGWRYETLIEPPDEIVVLPDPFHAGQWIRVIGPWGGAATYRRASGVEQFDHERIFYPVDPWADFVQNMRDIRDALRDLSRDQALTPAQERLATNVRHAIDEWEREE